MRSAPSPDTALRPLVIATCWSERFDDLLKSVARTGEALRTDSAGMPAGFLVEARLDLLARPVEGAELERLAAAAEGALLATCRPDGSGAPPAREDRMRLLSRAMALGARACDVEDDGGPLPDGKGGSIILSHHWPAGGPAPTRREIRERAASMASRVRASERAARPGPGAIGVVKIAAPVATAMGAADWLERPDLPAHVGWAPVPLGPSGAWTRVLARRHGHVAYVAAGRPLPGPDPGQIPLRDALGPFRVGSVSKSTRAFAVFGWPLEATWSPLLHSTLFCARGVDARLVPMPVEAAGEMLQLMDALDLDGAAVTMPHKEAARALADTQSRRAASSGVANTLRRRDGRIEAESFDGPAVAALLSAAIDLRGARVVIVGAGGAARAAAAELAASGASVIVVARRLERAEAVASGTGASAAALCELAGVPRDVLVNATPVGSLGFPGFVADPGALDAAVVVDMVTTPAQTPLVALARSRGRRVIDGLEMLAHQAAAQQAFWLEGSGTPPTTPSEALGVLREIVAGRG